MDEVIVKNTSVMDVGFVTDFLVEHYNAFVLRIELWGSNKLLGYIFRSVISFRRQL